MEYLRCYTSKVAIKGLENALNKASIYGRNIAMIKDAKKLEQSNYIFNKLSLLGSNCLKFYQPSF